MKEFIVFPQACKPQILNYRGHSVISSVVERPRWCKNAGFVTVLFSAHFLQPYCGEAMNDLALVRIHSVFS